MKTACLAVGLRSAPHLADHAVQDTVLLPGAAYVAAALRLERELFERAGARVRNAVFHAPVVLSADDTRLDVEATLREDGATEYVFREGGTRAATLEVAAAAAPSGSADAEPFSVDDFRGGAQAQLDRHRYYAELLANGNQYGPSLRGIRTLWRKGDESLAFIEVPGMTEGAEGAEGGAEARHTSAIDCLVQVLASFVLDQGRPFLLRSIERIDSLESLDWEHCASLWGLARLRTPGAAGGNDYVGEVEAFDTTGRRVLKLSGVAFTLAERGGEGDNAARLVVAANFTAEPIEDSLAFWSEHFGQRLRIGFAPYNQVFQQLLDPDSALGRNREGINAVLLALEEWAADGHGLGALTSARAEECFGARERTRLPDGLEIAQLNAHETAYLYEEIFEEQSYLRHGICLEEGDTVLDIGANIGIFSLFVQSRCPGARIYAFEPAPAAFDVLRANCAAYAPGARVFNAGVSERSGTATFTYYGKASVFSGFHAEEKGDRAALHAVVSNMLQRESAGDEPLEEYADELIADRLGRSEHQCRLVSVSDFMRENGVERINLLKIDAEKSELEILAGIRDEDWAKIDQLVIEVHDPSGDALERVLNQLRARGFRCATEQPELLRQAGLSNVYATRRTAGARAGAGHHAGSANLQRNAQEFCAALRAHMQRSTVPLVLCICPRSAVDAAVDDAERILLQEVSAIANVHTIAPAALLRRYPLENFHDQDAARAGHVPYTPEGYAALGTALMRAIHGVKRRPHKAIALDCDNTLWKGVCGEDGATGIELTAACRALQEFMLAQLQAGMLLCLCSKNNERDVAAVFERRGDMPLKLEHFAARRVNWQAKPKNLEALAVELGLGLDSFIFLDDDPVECAQVRRACPAVLTLQLPRDDAAIASFLDHVWAFDRSATTAEDRGRTRMVQENALRQEFRASAPSLQDFIAGLALHIDVAEAAEAELGRVAQLIARTSQFSLATRRRSDGELRQFLAQPGAGCASVRVADRFGDYGLVGAALYKFAPERLEVDSFLLSCRALGRGVEHAMAAWIGRRALAEGRHTVQFAYRPTERNRPAQEFIAGIGGPQPGEAEALWSLPAEQLAGVAYAPAERAIGESAPASPSRGPAGAPRDFADAWNSERVQALGQDLFSVDRILKAVEARLRASQVEPIGSQPAQAGSLEAALADIWARVLGRAQIGLHDNFFDAGGTSLKAVRIVALVKKELGQALQVVSLLECPTVAALAARLGASPAAPDPAPGEAARRGQRRREHQTRLRVS